MILAYRKATRNDLDEIGGIVRSAVDAMARDRIFQWDDLYPAREDFEEDIDHGQLHVGLIHGQIAVIYTLNQTCDQAYENGSWTYRDEPFFVIHRLCVNPAFQHKGIARSTLSHIEQQVAAMGIHVIRLDVFSQNPYALRLYRSSGYTEAGHADWRKGRFLLMEKRF